VPLTPFIGNQPRNVARDAKYALRWVDGALRVSLVYRADDEEWLAATREHSELVEIVDAVKKEIGGGSGGPFYINEYRQVIVPVGSGSSYWLAGEYTGRLEFEFEGHILSGDGKGLDGRRLFSGERWEGPHPGIPYVASASGDDIYYEMSPRPNVTKKVRLSTVAGQFRARAVARQVTDAKGGSGRFYVNEFHHIFAPQGGTMPLRYVYVGTLDIEGGWFPKLQ
jgi:hypothetical protein